MRDSDPKMEEQRQGFDEADFGLWYKDREHFFRDYDRFVKTVDVAKLGDTQLVELYKLAQERLNSEIDNRDNNPMAIGKDVEPAQKEIQDTSVTPRFEFLGRLGSELDKRKERLKAKGIPFPLTMDKRMFDRDISKGKVIDIGPDRTKLE